MRLAERRPLGRCLVATLGLFVATTLCFAGFAAAAHVATRAGGGAEAAARTAAANPAWLPHPTRLRAGGELTLTLKPGTTSQCTLTVAGPKHPAQEWRYPVGKLPMQLGFAPPADATTGPWRIAAACVPVGLSRVRTATTTPKWPARHPRRSCSLGCPRRS